ncbi:Sjogren's syndrome/scleroderma autoantigen 1 family protein [Salinirubrum litoreum]|uniref:Sjogren's syndrome/scleroderma autoantigen 1 family protein n=1 Tax=Salinirubrum litoreum TaxID=1126234 RepID=A0ABD5REN6_9EURY|nr:Sjogren's syndrome/scleroderma autoantigen 1 family protein [Salinirubrum litoreum]
MSDFDREAAREELREKFERDNEKRKTTQRMSELLLKGATMTNRHCDTCGDPIFRYQGQEFCPTCQNASVDGGPDSVQDAPDTEASSVESATDSTAQATDATDGTANRAADDASVPVEPASPDEAGATPADRRTQTPVDQPQPSTADHQRPTATPDPQQATPPAESPTPGSETAEPQPAPLAGDTADLDTARASLVRTVTRYSREAESADDPRRAKELLSVAHEAAETLAALDHTR